jgi:hypothetical protein
LKQAGLDEIAKVKGIPEDVAQEVFAVLRQSEGGGVDAGDEVGTDVGDAGTSGVGS